jgi:hypothetical protein
MRGDERKWLMGAAATSVLALGLLLLPAAPATASLAYVTGITSQPTEGGRQEPLDADCPAAMFSVGGGVYSDGPNQTSAIVQTAPTSPTGPGTSWEAVVDVYAPPVSLTAYAICDTAKPSDKVHFSAVAPGERATVKQDCPKGRHIYGGGVLSVANDGEVRAVSSRPFDGPDADSNRDDGWEATFDAVSTAGAQFAAEAICGEKQTLVKKSSTKIAGATEGFHEAHCGAGRRVTGGGAKLAVAQGGGALNSLLPFDDGDAHAVLDDGFSAFADNYGGPDRKLTVYSVCR